MTTPVRPNTGFDWSMYADATFAGLAVLIPVPLVDWTFEEFFRRRMPKAIAKNRGRALTAPVVAEMNQGGGSLFASCLMLPVKLTFGLIKQVSKKLVYVMTIKEATDKVSYYWHRAFLLDYMLEAGHLRDEQTAQVARRAMEQVLDNTSSPLSQLARQIASTPSNVWRTLRRARRGNEDASVEEAKNSMQQRWGDFSGYFETLAAQYERTYQHLGRGRR